MNKTLIKGMLPAVVALGLTGCSAEDSSLGSNTGSIAPEVALDTEVAASARSARSETELTAEDLVLALTSSDDSYSNSWNGVSAFPIDEKFKTGGYTMTASYGSLENEGFDKPYYFGSTDLTVTENNTTRVSLTAQLANSMVSVEYSDNFKSYMQAWSAELHTEGGEYIYYAQDETRPAYLRPGATTINVELTKPTGQSAKLLAANFATEPRHHYHVTVDLKQSAGDAVLIVKFDDTVDMEDIEIELSDELMNAPAPTVDARGFTPGSPLTFVAGQATADMAPKFAIMARGGLARVTLTTQSKSLVQQGWPESVDLMATPENLQSRMRALGFDCLGLWKNPDKMAVIDLSGVLNNITYLESGANENMFTVEVVDRFNKVCEQPVSFTVNIEKLELTLSNPETLMVEDDELVLTLTYNGAEPEKNIKFQYYNQRGTWTDLSVKSIAPATRGSETYRVVLTVPANDQDLQIRAVSGSNESATLEVTRTEPPFKIACDENDVFANRALLSVTGDNESPAELAAKAKLLLSTDGGASYSEYTSLTTNGGNLSLSNLNDNTEYTARIEIDGMQSRPIKFTTEEALQIPNGGFDDWSAEQKGDYQYLWSLGGGAWGTNNALTTSQSGSGSGNGTNTKGCAYKATSATIPANGRSTKTMDSGGFWGTNKSGDGHTTGDANLHSDRQHGGTNAALIRSVRWGSGNSASGKTSGQHFGTTADNPTPGQLFLGTFLNNEPVYGYNFKSRPASLSFYYRYEPVSAGNGDYGSVELTLYDAAGNVLSTTTRQLAEPAQAEQAQYTKVVLPFEYTSTEKAARLSLIFKSSANSDAMAKETSFWRCPGVKNVSGGEYSGSELYIDDVTLNY